MSQETLAWLNTNVLVGNVGENGKPWHYAEQYQGQLTNLYDGFIPVQDVIDRLFYWDAVEREVGFVSYEQLDPSLEPIEVWTKIPGEKRIVNNSNGEAYGNFKSGYQIHQYREWLLENVAALLDVAQGDLGIGSAGLLRRGGRAWVQVEPAHSRHVGGTILRRHLTATTSHDGTSASTYLTGDHIAVCDNTLTGAIMGAATKLRFKHTKNSMDKMALARETLEIVFEHQDETDQAIERLMNTTISDGQFWELVNTAFPKKPEGEVSKAGATKLDAVHGKFGTLWHFDNRVTPWKGTAWGAMMAFNTYRQWESPLRGVDRPERNMLSVLNGDAAKADDATVEMIDKLLEDINTSALVTN